jgi:hypothetical protein
LRIASRHDERNVPERAEPSGRRFKAGKPRPFINRMMPQSGDCELERKVHRMMVKVVLRSEDRRKIEEFEIVVERSGDLGRFHHELRRSNPDLIIFYSSG